jgi:hypothetical protein
MKFKWQNILIALGLVVALILLIDFNHRMEELNRLTAKLATVRAEGTAVMRTQEALLTQVAFATSDEAVEPWAYESKWIRPGEHPVELLPAGGVTPTPQPATIVQTQPLPNWKIWWELFFGAN